MKENAIKFNFYIDTFLRDKSTKKPRTANIGLAIVAKKLDN